MNNSKVKNTLDDDTYLEIVGENYSQESDHIKIFDGTYFQLSRSIDFNKSFTITLTFQALENSNWMRLIDFGNGMENGNFIISQFSNSADLFIQNFIGYSINFKIISSVFLKSQICFISVSCDKLNNEMEVTFSTKTYTKSYKFNDLILPNQTTAYNFIGKSHWTSDGNFKGALYNFEMYDGVLNKYDISRIRDEKFRKYTEINITPIIETKIDSIVRYTPVYEYLQYIEISSIETINASLDGEILWTDNNYVAWNPSRIVIDNSGTYMFVTYLNGNVLLYTKINDTWSLQNKPFATLPKLLVSGEKGLVGCILQEDFSETNPYIFLTYQAVINGTGYNKVTRISFRKVNGYYTATDYVDVYSGDFFSSAHQIMNGWCNKDKVYVVVGDQWRPQFTRDMTSDIGKIICMNYDGTDKKIVAKAVRNPYTTVKLPSHIDSKERVLGVENGNNVARVWFAHIDEKFDDVLDMGWTGTDNIEWENSEDTNYPNPYFKPNIVLQTFQNDPSPNGLDIFPVSFTHEKFWHTIPEFTISGIISFFGKSNNNVPINFEKTLCTFQIVNVGGAQPGFNIKPIIELKEEYKTQWNNPLAVSFNKNDNTFVFIDIMTGNIHQVKFKN